MPGEVLVDPIRADVLVERGFIQEVPDDYVSKLPDAQERADKRAEREQKRLDREAKTEEDRIRKEGEALLLANRPDAKRLAKKLGSPLDEVFALSDEEYEQGLELLDESDTDEDESDSGEAAPPAEGGAESTVTPVMTIGTPG